MNTTAVAEMLGVSASTVQRWVKHLGLEMQRNEYGHYIYSEEDIEKLKKFQQELQKGTAVPKSHMMKKQRRGAAVVKSRSLLQEEELQTKIKELENRLNNKADSVVAYQLLQHRGEIEELEHKVVMLTEQLEELQEKFAEMATAIENMQKEKKKKKTTFLKAIFRTKHKSQN